MIGTLNSEIIQSFKIKFEQNCVLLLLESYKKVVSKINFKELSENNITAHLVGILRSDPTRLNLQISIQRETYIDNAEIYSGLQNADEAVRIDIKYITWSSSLEYEYFMEAKNLSENNWTKSTNKAQVSAYKQQKRYIETGIQNFISNKYPNGCLIGYIVEGSPDNIVLGINKILTKANRSNEQLIKNSSKEFNYYFTSNHRGNKIEKLNHYLLNFC